MSKLFLSTITELTLRYRCFPASLSNQRFPLWRSLIAIGGSVVLGSPAFADVKVPSPDHPSGSNVTAVQLSEVQSRGQFERSGVRPSPAVTLSPQPDNASETLASVASRKASDLLPASAPQLAREPVIAVSNNVGSLDQLLTAQPLTSPPAEQRGAELLQEASQDVVAQLTSPPPVQCDPELGCLPAQPPLQPLRRPVDPFADNSVEPIPTPNCPDGNFDPELGCLILTTPPATAQSAPPVLYLLPRLDYFNSSNILSGTDPVDDSLLRPGLSLLFVPRLGPRTFLIAAAEGAFVRYFNQPEFDYDEMRFRVGISHQLTSTMSGEIGWSNQQLFIASNRLVGLTQGSRFLNDHSIRLELSRRDQLSRRLLLNTFYQLRVSFAEPIDRSRITNTLYASLNYAVRPNLQAALDYQLTISHFTEQKREDFYHQLLARLTMTAFRNTQLSLYAGTSFGRSSERAIDFDGLVLGVSLTANLVIF